MTSDPYDPINAAMRSLHSGNLIAAKDARIRQLEEEIIALRKELADAQENYHLLNKAVAKVLNGGKPTL